MSINKYINPNTNPRLDFYCDKLTAESLNTETLTAVDVSTNTIESKVFKTPLNLFNLDDEKLSANLLYSDTITSDNIILNPTSGQESDIFLSADIKRLATGENITNTRSLQLTGASANPYFQTISGYNLRVPAVTGSTDLLKYSTEFCLITGNEAGTTTNSTLKISVKAVYPFGANYQSPETRFRILPIPGVSFDDCEIIGITGTGFVGSDPPFSSYNVLPSSFLTTGANKSIEVIFREFSTTKFLPFEKFFMNIEVQLKFLII